MSASDQPFDVEQFARDTIKAIEWSDDDAEELENRVIRLEEIVAARWPRSLVLRWRLAREIRASVAAVSDEIAPRGDFRGRRVEASVQRVALRRQQRAARNRDTS